MEEIRLSYQQVANYAVLINVIVSALFGLFPLLAGLRLNNRKYGLIAFFGSIVLGVLGIVLSFPFAMIMHWLILKPISASKTLDGVAENVDEDDRSEADLRPAENS